MSRKQNMVTENETEWQIRVKTAKNTTLSLQAMYFYQKLVKTAKIRIFPYITVPRNDLRQQSLISVIVNSDVLKCLKT